MVALRARIAAVMAISARAGGPARRGTFNNDVRPVLVYHLDHMPANTTDHLGPANVFHILSPIVAMLVTVVFEGHFRSLPTHVEVGHEVAIGDSDLGNRPG